MSSNATTSSKTRRNRFSLNVFAALLTLALGTFILPRPAAAATCAGAFASWETTGSRLTYDITSSSTVTDSIAEWDSDIVKIRHNIAGIMILGAKGVAIKADLYKWDSVNEEADLLDSLVFDGGSGDPYTTPVESGDYCLEITDFEESEGDYDLNINFLDGCTLGILAPNTCGGL